MQTLLANNIEAVSYHAGMDAQDRKWVQENFMAGKAKVIVATNAFGLGIDKRDIRFVIHYDMPGTIEAYYQEAGRAGRDGKQSFCLLLYSPRDRYLQEFFIKGDNPPPETILEIYEILKDYPFGEDQRGDSDTVLITYATIAEQLSEKLPEMAVGTAIKILEREGYIARSHERVGQAYVKARNSQLATRSSFTTKSKQQKETFERLLEKYGRELEAGWYFNFEEAAEILKIKKDSFMRLVKKLFDSGLIDYLPPFRGTELKILKRVEGDKVKLDFDALKYKLKHAYKKVDLMENYIYHSACRQKYILDYFGELEALACAKCDNCLVKNMDEVETVRVEEKQKKKPTRLSTKLTQLETLELWNKGMSVEKIAEARELSAGMIIGHLCFLAEKGLGIEIDKLVKPERQKKILDAANKVGRDKLTPIREALGEDYSWDEIKLTLAKMRARK